TPSEFYANWREREMSEQELEERISSIIGEKIDDATYAQLLLDLNGSTYGHQQKLSRKPTEQDRTAVAMLSPERLLDITKNYVLYDGAQKKVMRYQQYFAIN